MNELQTYFERHRGSLEQAAAQRVDISPFVSSVLICVAENQKLQQCTPQSILKASCEAASLGLTIDSTRGLASLVPYGDQARLQIGYAGYVALCYRSGQIKSIIAEAVRGSDVFEFELGSAPYIRHQPLGDVASEYVAVYAVARTLADGIVATVKSRAEIDAHRDQFAQGYTRSDSPWRTSWAAMAKKTVIRQLVRWLPQAGDAHLAARREEYAAAGVLPAADNGEPAAAPTAAENSEVPA